MFLIRERHIMALINALIYAPSFLQSESRLTGSLRFFYDRVNGLISLYALSFILAAIFLVFYKKAKASHLILASLPQLFFSFVMLDYLRQTPDPLWISALFQFGFSLVFIFLIYSRYYNLKFGLGDL